MINEYIQHLEDSTDKMGVCEKILGNLEDLYELAGIYDNSNRLLTLLELHCEVAYTHQKEFDSKELKAFQEGLGSIKNMLKQCSLEVKAKSVEESSPKESSP